MSRTIRVCVAVLAVWVASAAHAAVFHTANVASINALTNDAVDADSLQPELKVCAMALRPIAPALPTGAGHPLAESLGLQGVTMELTDDEKIYVAGFLSGVTDGSPGVPVLPGTAFVEMALAAAHELAPSATVSLERELGVNPALRKR